LAGETPEQTVVREVGEELMREVKILHCLGAAVQYFSADGLDYRMVAVFFEAVFVGDAAGIGEHELYWLEPAEIEHAFFHQSHAWATLQR